MDMDTGDAPGDLFPGCGPVELRRWVSRRKNQGRENLQRKWMEMSGIFYRFPELVDSNLDTSLFLEWFKSKCPKSGDVSPRNPSNIISDSIWWEWWNIIDSRGTSVLIVFEILELRVMHIASWKTLYKFKSSICGRFPVICNLSKTRTFHSPCS